MYALTLSHLDATNHCRVNPAFVSCTAVCVHHRLEKVVSSSDEIVRGHRRESSMFPAEDENHKFIVEEEFRLHGWVVVFFALFLSSSPQKSEKIVRGHKREKR